ncbi:hypothetical protein INT45_010279 [Circinella minor]|uniref:Ndc10 domain-containing protein n=1 Tax=Circinella minor TaxID=1195481 RepID=A0A8H7RW72_9FUNG|nr:hypothetical protein INT45_010279 [Circinella minor]
MATLLMLKWRKLLISFGQMELLNLVFEMVHRFYCSTMVCFAAKVFEKMEFTDLQSLYLEDEGPSQCHTLVMILMQRKTNKFGCIEVAGSHQRNNRESSKELSYRQHLKAITKVFEGACLHSKAKTHAMCGAAARMAEIGGSSEGAIRHAGHWNTSSLTTVYLTNLPHQLLRTLAEFPTERGYFYLSRANVQLPEELCKKNFKFVDYWRQKLDEGNVEQVSCAADMFLKLLDRLRVVFLQDSVLLKKRYPHHYLWNHPLFQSELSVDAAVEITEEPEQLQPQRAVPLVAQHLSEINQQIAFRFDAQAQAQQAAQMQVLQSLLSVVTPFQVLVPHISSLATLAQQIASYTSGQAPLQVTLNLGNVSQQQPTQEQTHSQPSPQPQQQPQQPQQPSLTTTSISLHFFPPPPLVQSLALAPTPDQLPVSTYKVSHNTVTFNMLWQRLYHVEWRRETKERRFYNRRRIIIEGLKNYAAQHRLTNEAAVTLLEEKRSKQRKTLHWIADNPSIFFNV